MEPQKTSKPTVLQWTLIIICIIGVAMIAAVVAQLFPHYLYSFVFGTIFLGAWMAAQHWEDLTFRFLYESSSFHAGVILWLATLAFLIFRHFGLIPHWIVNLFS